MVDDLAFMPEVFVEFADRLKSVLDGNAEEARLSPIGSELVLTINRAGKIMHMHIAIKECNVRYPDTTASASGAVAVDVGHRWARELKEYDERLNEWMVGKEAC